VTQHKERGSRADQGQKLHFANLVAFSNEGRKHRCGHRPGRHLVRSSQTVKTTVLLRAVEGVEAMRKAGEATYLRPGQQQ
jgi:hypothetical protein